MTPPVRPARILITGNMGYVGPSVVARLRESYPDASLIGLDAGYFAHCLTGCSAIPERQLDYQHFGDVRAVSPSFLDDADAVVHLAAISNDPIGNAYDEVTLEINYEATVRLAREAKAAGVRSFVFAGSCSIYGVSDKDATGARLPELEDFESSGRGTIRFRPDKPLPVALVNTLVKARVART